LEGCSITWGVRALMRNRVKREKLKQTNNGEKIDRYKGLEEKDKGVQNLQNQATGKAKTTGRCISCTEGKNTRIETALPSSNQGPQLEQEN